jgi:hypothetical protein
MCLTGRQAVKFAQQAPASLATRFLVSTQRLYDDDDNLGYTCTSTTSPMYAILHPSVYKSGEGCTVGSCDKTDACE